MRTQVVSAGASGPAHVAESAPGSGPRLRIAFTGAGMVSEVHRLALSKVDGVSLVGVFDPDQRRREQRAEAWGVAPYATLDELLSDEPDGVYVLSPTDTHVATALRALDAGRHVFVEKPVATTGAAVDGLLRAGVRADRVVMPGHNYAYIPEFQRTARLVRDGSLGTVRALWVTYAIAHPEAVAAAYGGVLEEVMVHHTYLTLALLGAPTRVHAGVAQPAWVAHPAEDQAWMTWEYPRGVSAHLFASFAVDDDSADPWTFVIKVLGTNGSASMTWRSSVFRRALGTLSIGIPAYEESYEHETAAFRDAVLHGAPLTSTLADAAVSARILDAAYQAAEAHTAAARHDPAARGSARADAPINDLENGVTRW